VHPLAASSLSLAWRARADPIPGPSSTPPQSCSLGRPGSCRPPLSALNPTYAKASSRLPHASNQLLLADLLGVVPSQLLTSYVLHTLDDYSECAVVTSSSIPSPPLRTLLLLLMSQRAAALRSLSEPMTGSKPYHGGRQPPVGRS